MEFDKKAYKQEFENALTEGTIRKSNEFFKIKLFLKKGENSLLIAKYVKDLKPAKGQPEKLYWNYWAITISYYSILYAAKAAILTKGYETKDHTSAQIALGHLLVPDQIEKEDLQILQQAHKIFEDEYVKYFEDARKEAHTARYTAIKTYTEKRLEEVYDNAQKFIAKLPSYYKIKNQARNKRASNKATHTNPTMLKEAKELKILNILNDRDADGISDLNELKYKTDYNAFDTDEDGYGDGYELTKGMNPLIPDGAGNKPLQTCTDCLLTIQKGGLLIVNLQNYAQQSTIEITTNSTITITGNTHRQVFKHTQNSTKNTSTINATKTKNQLELTSTNISQIIYTNK